MEGKSFSQKVRFLTQCLPIAFTFLNDAVFTFGKSFWKALKYLSWATTHDLVIDSSGTDHVIVQKSWLKNLKR